LQQCLDRFALVAAERIALVTVRHHHLMLREDAAGQCMRPDTLAIAAPLHLLQGPPVIREGTIEGAEVSVVVAEVDEGQGNERILMQDLFITLSCRHVVGRAYELALAMRELIESA
jgi:hypothetical protein